jgi:hypothetical protein
VINIMMPKIQPNQALIKALEVMLAKARSGTITDGLLLGADYAGDGRQEWFHHFSIERDEDVITFVGELDIFKDVLKASVHNTRNRAAAIKGVKSMSGALS